MGEVLEPLLVLLLPEPLVPARGGRPPGSDSLLSARPGWKAETWEEEEGGSEPVGGVEVAGGGGWSDVVLGGGGHRWRSTGSSAAPERGMLANGGEAGSVEPYGGA